MNKENNEWKTPDEIWVPLNEEFGFDLDVCAADWNHQCENYYTIKDDSLSKKWAGTAWMNPPYGREIEKFVKKAYQESLRGSTVVCLIPSRAETKWFHDYCLKGEVRFIKGRIHFTHENGHTGRPRFGNIVVIFRPPKTRKS